MALIFDRDLWPRQSFDPSCPSGGSWYVCTTGSRFVGCCAGSIDPCDETTSCPSKNLKPASFDTAEYGTFPDQTCDADSNWYTCAGTDPAFMGCCKSNPCSSGCPTKDLTAASLSTDEAAASAFITTSATAAATSTAAATITPAAASSSPGNHVGAIAGGVIGGVAGIVLVLIGVLWCLKRKRRARKNELKQQAIEGPYYNEDGYFHSDPHLRRRADSPYIPPPEEEDTQRRTIYSQEHSEGIEVDDRPQEPAPTRPDTAEQHLTSTTQPFNVSPNVSRPPSVSNPPGIGNPPSINNPPSIGHSWFTRDSIFVNGSPHLASIPSPDEQRRVSWIENPRPHNNNSPVITPVHSPIHNQPDYFSHYENHAHQVSHGPQDSISPQTHYFELDDTQLSPPVELEAIEAAPKKQEIEDTAQAPVEQLGQRRGRHDVEEGKTESAYFSPDDIGKPQSRG